MHPLEIEAIESMANQIKGAGNKGRNIVEVGQALIEDGYYKKWVEKALQEVARHFEISKDELEAFKKINMPNG